VGTTDTDYTGPLDDPECTPGDIAYLLDAVNAVTTADLGPSDITGTWAGLRPLVKNALTERTADLSRRHRVEVAPSGLVTVTGGKLTTYRKMAVDAVAAAVTVVGAGARRSPTAHLPLRGAVGLEYLRRPGTATRLGVPAPLLDHLVGRYGGETTRVLAAARSDPGLLDPLVPGLAYVRAEAVWAVQAEMARTLEDVLSRRTRSLLLDREATVTAAPSVAALIGPLLGWDPAEQARQVADLSGLAARERAAVGG